MVSSVNNTKSTTELSVRQQILKWLQDNKAIKTEQTENLTPETIQKIANGEYGITLKDFSDFHSYNSAMKQLFGESSMNNLYKQEISGFLKSSEKTAKNFYEKLNSLGISNQKALKIMKAFNAYSASSNILNQKSFISAKI